MIGNSVKMRLRFKIEGLLAKLIEPLLVKLVEEDWECCVLHVAALLANYHSPDKPVWSWPNLWPPDENHMIRTWAT